MTPSLYPAQSQYAVDAMHANPIEGFWPIVKRGIAGMLHKVSKKTCICTSMTFEFWHDQCSNAGIFGAAIKVC